MKSQETYQQWDLEYVWHPFTQMQNWSGKKPVVIERAEGIYIWDTQGKKYLDGVSSLWVTVHGHAHPHINKAIQRQVEKLDHSTLLGLGNVPSIELAKRLVEIAPAGLAKVFYSDNGSTAVEVALKMAFQYWQQTKPSENVRNPKNKTRFAALNMAYHGDTLGSVSVGGMDLFHRVYKPLLFKTLRVETPHAYRFHPHPSREAAERDRLQQLEKCFERHHHELAAFVLEPRIQGAAGMLTAPDGYLKRVRQLCDQYQVLLIADEVATGFGRTGKMFACEKEDVRPDFLCLAKGITGGYLPLAVTLTTQNVYDAFLGEISELKTFFHGHTYTGNPIACAAALANLDLFEAESFWNDLNDKIQYWKQLLDSLADHPHVGDIRQEGMIVGIELVKDKQRKQSFEYHEQVGNRICFAAREKGLMIRPLADVLVLMPPLCISKEEIAWLTQQVTDSIQEVLGP